MKRSISWILMGSLLFNGAIQASAQIRGGSDVGTAVDFRILADGYQIGYLKDMFSKPLLVLSPVQGGVLASITAQSSEEFALAENLLNYLEQKLPKGRYQPKGNNNVLITTGMRHLPSQEEVYKLLEDVAQILKPQAASLGLGQSKMVVPKN